MTSGPLAFEDAFEIIRPALPDDSLVLVGGQAVSYWLDYYRKRDASLAGLSGVTSDDVDFFGNREAARRFAAAIQGALKLPSFDDTGPNSALVTFKDNRGAERIIDFLRFVHGLNDDELVRRTAVPVELTSRDGEPLGIELRVLHPVLCLQSRVSNTSTLTKYQTPRALRQLAAAIGCARGYITERCDVGDPRGAHRAIRLIGELAQSRAGRDVYRRFELDVFDAIPKDARLGEQFFAKNLPRLLRRPGRV